MKGFTIALCSFDNTNCETPFDHYDMTDWQGPVCEWPEVVKRWHARGMRCNTDANVSLLVSGDSFMARMIAADTSAA